MSDHRRRRRRLPWARFHRSRLCADAEDWPLSDGEARELRDRIEAAYRALRQLPGVEDEATFPSENDDDND